MRWAWWRHDALGGLPWQQYGDTHFEMLQAERNPMIRFYVICCYLFLHKWGSCTFSWFSRSFKNINMKKSDGIKLYWTEAKRNWKKSVVATGIMNYSSGEATLESWVRCCSIILFFIMGRVLIATPTTLRAILPFTPSFILEVCMMYLSIIFCSPRSFLRE